MTMTKHDKVYCALAKLKEMKLLAFEVQDLLKDEEIDEELSNLLITDNISDKLEVLLNDCLLSVNYTDGSGITPISNFEKQRRIDYGVSTKRLNDARKKYYHNQNLCGEVGRDYHHSYKQ